jgi:tetratricopeptide (TPR) repeat protein
MPLTFTFALCQNQTFELRCSISDRTVGNRSLDTEALATLINLCEEKYYTQYIDSYAELKKIGRELYQWLDGKEGWLRQGLQEDGDRKIYLDLIQTSEAQALNPQTQRIALGLAHLPWELLHDGSGFLLGEASVLPVRSVQQRQNSAQNGYVGVQNRPLRLLFMATSPEYPGISPLGFEREEAKILDATKEQPLALVVEESGSVAELKNLVQSYDEDYFDVFHLTGHGVIYTENAFGKLLPKGKKIKDYTPCFITEDDFGNVVFTTAEDLGKAFKNRFPRVIFLSGCHTGQLADGGTVPSMAQALVKAGAAVVLGWARPVYDTTGITAAEALYEALATGATVEEAVIATHQKMLEKERPDGHLLRIYRDTREIQGLVTPLRTKGREKLKFKAPETEFLDENNIVKVASRGEFVGRRKALQRCLKALRETSDEIGVFIAGMGGLGKSSLAARLCTRVQSQRENFERVVLIGVVDEVALINKLANKYQRYAGVPALLNEPGISLQGRLQNFFEAVETQHGKPLLLVLDDFEQNIPPANIEDGSLRMASEAYRVLEAICAALAENQAESRLIVTCRYLREDTLPPHNLHLESLAAMGKADIDKIVRDLEGEVKEKLRQQRIIKIADGNPRLLKWLLDVVQQPGITGDELLTRLEAVELKFRENILAQTLLGGLEDGEKKFLARLSVFRLPVTEDIVRDVAFSDEVGEARNVECLHRLVGLSLVESATVYGTQQREYRVTRILEPLLEEVLTVEEWQTSKKTATASIYKSWWEEAENCYEKQVWEIIRLAVATAEKSIAVTVGEVVAEYWVNSSRFVEALEICREILQLGENYRILGTIARAEVALGLVIEAIEHFQTALELCPEGDVEEKAATLYNMAGLKAQEGDIEGAITLYNQSLQISESINYVGGKASTLHQIAKLKAQEGDISGAITFYNQSLQISESINYVKTKAGTLLSIANLKTTQGDIEGAIALYNQSLQISESINDVQGEAATLHAIAGLKAQEGDIEGAITLYNQSLQISESINYVGGKATTLHEMAVLKAQEGDTEGAIALYNQSLQISESINDVREQAATLHAIAGLKAQEGDTEGAIVLYNQSLQISESINYVRGKAATLYRIAGLKANQGDIEGAIALYNQSLQITESINDMQSKAATLCQIARLKANQGDIEGAIALYNQSLQITESINDMQGKAVTIAGLAYWEGERGNKTKQLELNLEAAKNLGKIRDYINLHTVLDNLGVADETKRIIYFAQAVWLCLRVQIPLAATVATFEWMYNQFPQSDEMQALLGAAALYLCTVHGDGHPQLEELQQRSFKILAGAAVAQGIETQEAFDTWIVQERLNDEEYFIPRLVEKLEEIVGDGWLFERF